MPTQDQVLDNIALTMSDQKLFGDVFQLSIKFRNLIDNGGSSTQDVLGLSQDSD